MPKYTYAITTANGRVGGRLARALLGAGHAVRAMGRDLARLKPLADLGAEPLVGELSDQGYVERAFAGADAAFLVDKASPTAASFAGAFHDAGAVYARAAASTRLPHALFLSAMGAHDPSLDGLIGIHRDVEQQLDAIGTLRTVHLRAAAFLENLFYFLPAIQATGALATPIAPDMPQDWVATRDLADIAARLLLDLPWPRKQRVVEVRTAETASMSSIAAQIRQSLGRPFQAARLPREKHVAAMLAHGAGHDFANRMNDTWEIFSVRSVRDPAQAETIAAPTSAAAFVEDTFVPALRGGAAAKTELST